MSIAVVVNQQRLAAILGKDATPELAAARIEEIRKVVASATGMNEARGDVINVSSVEFIDGLDGVEIAEPGLLDKAGQHVGTMINASAFVVVVFLVIFFGLRPLAASLGKPAPAAIAGPSFEAVQRSLPLPDADQAAPAGALPGARAQNPLDDLRQKIRPAPQERLARMVDLNEERTAQILRKWAHQEAAG
jgi:flagellar M-ring protein FliF